MLVLYRMRVLDSPTYLSLVACVEQHPRLAERLHLLVADNSPGPQPLPPELRAEYLHDGRNPGLAQRYDEALRRAVRLGAQWLLLLDDDTTLTPGWFATLFQVLDAAPAAEIAAVVPRLQAPDGNLLSPHLPAFRDSSFALDAGSSGILPGLVRVFNSGAALRLTTLQQAGGFDEKYTLDAVDHATFARLQAAGGRILLLAESLGHELSSARQSPARESARLAAEDHFYRQYGSPEERRRRRNFLVRAALGSLRQGELLRALRLLLAALRQTRQVQI